MELGGFLLPPAQFAKEPGAGKGPVAVGGTCRDSQNLRGLAIRKADKVGCVYTKVRKP